MRARLWTLPVFTAGCLHDGTTAEQHADTPVTEVQPTDTGWGSAPLPAPISQLKVDIAGPSDARIGCPVDATVTLTNTGEVPLEVRGLSTEGAAWWVEPVHTPLEPGASAELALHRTGAATASAAPGLHVESDAEAQTGNAQFWTAALPTAPASTLESEAPRIGALDVVVVASPEGLNDPHPGHPLYDGLPAMADALTAAGIDWQLTLVGNANGCPSADWPVITPESSGWDSEAALVAAMNGPTKCEVYGRELFVAGQTFAQLAPGACAESTHRSGTPVSLVLVRIGHVVRPESDWDRLLSDIAEQVGAPELRVDEVVNTASGDAEDWLAAMGGERHTIETWVAAIPSFVDQLPVVEDFSLPIDPADAGAVVVTIDGEPDHTWRLADGELSWDAAERPAPGAQVAVSYVDASECP